MTVGALQEDVSKARRTPTVAAATSSLPSLQSGTPSQRKLRLTQRSSPPPHWNLSAPQAWGGRHEESSPQVLASLASW